jgi:hypothetical protein
MQSVLFLLLCLQTVMSQAGFPGVIHETPTPQPHWRPRQESSQTPPNGCHTQDVLFSDDTAGSPDQYSSTRSWRTIDITDSLPDGTALSKTWFADGAPLNTSAYLMSKPITLPATGSIFFSFWHKFDTERGYDGAMVYYSTDGTSTWHDMGDHFTENGYNFQMFTQRGALPAFSGSSGSEFNKTLADISALHGQTINFVFILMTDFSIPSVGWWVNNIKLWSATCPGQGASPADTWPTSPPDATANQPINSNSNGRTSDNTAAINLATAALVISILTSAFTLVLAIVGFSYFYTWRTREARKAAIPMVNIGSLDNPAPSPRS